LQLFTSELTFASHPFAGLLSQSLKPELHVGTQAPPVHVVVPCPFVQVRPQAPQFEIVLSGVSQPFFGFPSQSPKPAPQVGTQAPPVHVVEPFALVHGWPQPPQCDVDDCVSVSQPLFALPSQLPNPALHVGVHVPLGHVVEPCAFEHVVLHAPQFAIVFNDASHPFVTSPSQLPKLPLQVIEHEPSAQPGVPLALEHDVPQAPQFKTLVCVLTSQPLVATPSQLPNPALQVPSVHAPDAHDSEAFAKSHCAPQDPQFERVVRLVSQPLAALPSQLPNPPLHVPSWQAPPKQLAPALA
jgi:hypothetical protein